MNYYFFIWIDTVGVPTVIIYTLYLYRGTIRLMYVISEKDFFAYLERDHHYIDFLLSCFHLQTCFWFNTILSHSTPNCKWGFLSAGKNAGQKKRENAVTCENKKIKKVLPSS
tara:strand:- start:64 stop:399 length:336 start_codon:yes stop_codon:yes gene_type:complete